MTTIKLGDDIVNCLFQLFSAINLMFGRNQQRVVEASKAGHVADHRRELMMTLSHRSSNVVVRCLSSSTVE